MKNTSQKIFINGYNYQINHSLCVWKETSKIQQHHSQYQIFSFLNLLSRTTKKLSSMPSLSAPSQQNQQILLKQQLFELAHELQLARLSNENLLTEVTDLKQKEKQLKQINNTLLENLNHSQKQIKDEITLTIDGEFLTKRIQQLEEQLQKYRNEVSDSVDRRVKKIVNQYTQEKDLEYQKRKSRFSLNSAAGNSRRRSYIEKHEHKHYNIEYNNNYSDQKSRRQIQQNSTFTENRSTFNENRSTFNENRSIFNENRSAFNENLSYQPSEININHKIICQKCLELKQLVQQKDQHIQRLQQKLAAMMLNHRPSSKSSLDCPASHIQINSIIKQQTEEWKLKYLQTLKLYENLKQQHNAKLDELNSLQSKNQSSAENYIVTHFPIKEFKKKQVYSNVRLNVPQNSNPCQSRLYKEQENREEQMLQQIKKIVNGLTKNKKNQIQQKPIDKSAQNMYTMEKNSRLSNIGSASKITQLSGFDGGAFTIKEGVNRYGKHNGIF